MYCQLLCGLVQRDDVVRTGTSFATSFLKIIKFLEDHWQELCSNIRIGCISGWITNSSRRKAVSSVLIKQMPDLANLIEQECSKKSWEGIIQRLWPRARPSDVSYTLLPNMAYYEFLSLEETKEMKQEDQPQCIPNSNDKVGKNKPAKGEIVDLANVKIGQHYELVVTTYTGLYRYRTGDILAVISFLNNAPQFRFVQRRNVILSIDVDKTSEEDLLKAISEAMRLLEPLGFLLKDYTSCTDTSTCPGHYVLFWELQMRRNAELPELDSALMERCCSTMEQSLDRVYRLLRNLTKEIGPLEIRVVKNGTFDQLMDLFLSLGSSVSQYKTPRCIESEKTIQMLNSRVVGRFSSKVVPFWSPQLGT